MAVACYICNIVLHSQHVKHFLEGRASVCECCITVRDPKRLWGRQVNGLNGLDSHFDDISKREFVRTAVRYIQATAAE